MTQAGSRLARNLFILVLIAAMLIAAGYAYLRHQKTYPSTEDAYVHANILYVAPQISGKVIKVNVSDYQSVNAGDLLVQLDPAPYQAAYQQARAAYEAASQNNKAADDAILAASANVRKAVAQLTDVQQSYRRTMDLLAKGLLSQQQADNAKAQLAAARTEVDAARAQMSQLITSQGAKGEQAPLVKQAAAALTRATLDLSHTNIVAPHDGKLGKVSIRPGSVVAPGTAMMPLVEQGTYWLQANYKESDVGHLLPGMAAKIVLDMYPNTTYSGRIVAISPASGSSFSLLPPENATGNWVKVPQRFPVNISIESRTNQPLLRVGASAEVTIDTQDRVISKNISHQGSETRLSASQVKGVQAQ